MKFNLQFSERKRFIRVNSGTKHTGFVDERPLSVSEMYFRAINGIPLSVPTSKNNNIPINGSFYNDDFDVIDLAIKNTLKFNKEQQDKALAESQRRKEELRQFDEWRKTQKLATPTSSDATIPNGAVDDVNVSN